MPPQVTFAPRPRVATALEAVWRMPAGPFTYARFVLDSLAYDVTGP